MVAIRMLCKTAVEMYYNYYTLALIDGSTYKRLILTAFESILLSGLALESLEEYYSIIAPQ